MPAIKLHRVYTSLHKVVRAFTDDADQCGLRNNLIAAQLFRDGLLKDAALSNGVVIEQMEDDEDYAHCEECDARELEDEMVSHGEISVCPACHAKWQAERDACVHRWVMADDDMGEPGHSCERCGWFLHESHGPLPTGPACAPLVHPVAADSEAL